MRFTCADIEGARLRIWSRRSSLSQRLSQVAAFNRSLLPPASQTFRRELNKVKIRGHRGVALCPFHPDRTPSLTFDLRKGLWHCFPCGFGGDQVTLVMKLHRLSFPDAARYLGAWTEATTKEERARITRCREQRERVEVAAEAVTAKERELRVQARDEMHRLEASLVDAHADDIANKILPELRVSMCAYYLLAFGAVAERARFVLGTDGERVRLIDAVMLSGYVCDDDGHITEVSL
jgi:hypothetical protein